MTFSERMKDLLSQGAAVSKDIASKAGEKASDWGEKGYRASRDFLNKAGAKAQELGTKGVLTVEIKQLEGQAQKLLARLGAEAYRVFAEEGGDSIPVENPVFKSLLAEIGGVKETIEAKEKALDCLKGAPVAAE